MIIRDRGKKRRTINISHAITNPVIAVGNPLTWISRIFTSIWNTIYILGGLALTIYLLMGALTYLTSGGDKAQIEKAQKTLSNAILGLAILAISYPVIVIIEKVLGINILNINWPTP